MDHEWSTSALGEEQAGWDWFSIQLDDDTELMLFQLRRADGSVDGFSSGTLIAADGSDAERWVWAISASRSTTAGAARAPRAEYPAEMDSVRALSGSAVDHRPVARRPGDGCVAEVLGGRGEGGGYAQRATGRGHWIRAS